MTTAAVGEERSIVDDLFHALSQPLTSLRCSLEVALLEPRTLGQYQEILGQGLGLAEQISGLVEDLRQFWDSEEAHCLKDPGSLEKCLDDVVAVVGPLAESEGKSIVLTNFSSGLKIAGPGMQRALFLLLRHGIAICAAGRSIEVENLWPRAAIRISVPSCISDQDDENKREALRRRVQMAIARRYLMASGCVCREQKRAEMWSCELLLCRDRERDDGR